MQIVLKFERNQSRINTHIHKRIKLGDKNNLNKQKVFLSTFVKKKIVKIFSLPVFVINFHTFFLFNLNLKEIEFSIDVHRCY